MPRNCSAAHESNRQASNSRLNRRNGKLFHSGNVPHPTPCNSAKHRTRKPRLIVWRRRSRQGSAPRRPRLHLDPPAAAREFASRFSSRESVAFDFGKSFVGCHAPYNRVRLDLQPEKHPVIGACCVGHTPTRCALVRLSSRDRRKSR